MKQIPLDEICDAFVEILEQSHQEPDPTTEERRLIRMAINYTLAYSYKDVRKDQPMTFDNIEIGETYEFRPVSSVHAYLRSKKVQIKKKNRSKVQGTLVEDAGNHKAGTTFTIPPDSLQEVSR